MEKWTPEQHAAYKTAESESFRAGLRALVGRGAADADLDQAIAIFWEKVVDAVWKEERFVEMVQEHKAFVNAEDPSPILADMRFVYGGRAETPNQQRLKRLYDKDPHKFLQRMESLERAFSNGVARKQTRAEELKRMVAKRMEAQGEIEEDLGTDKALALCEQILAEYKKEEK